MLRERARNEPRIFSFVKRILFPRPPRALPDAPVPGTGGPAQAGAEAPTLPGAPVPGTAGYTPAQQRQLETLCAQLFRKKSFVTSGKLQLIGLEKIRLRMGSEWPALKSFVFRVADEALARHLGPGDIFVRLNDDAYVIIFGDASYNQGHVTASLIADEIRDRLFNSGHEALRDVGVHRHVVETKTADLASLSPAEALAVMTFRNSPEKPAGRREQELREIDLGAALSHAAAALKAAGPAVSAAEAASGVSYEPLWNVKKNALTCYLCRPDMDRQAAGIEKDLFVLGCVAAELRRMEADGRRFFIVCPVRHDTLYRQGNFTRYAAACRAIPDSQRKMLVLLMTDLREDLHKNNGFWFSGELRNLCRHFFLDLDIAQAPDFAALSRYGFDGVGISLDGREGEQLTLGRLRVFQEQAAAAGIPKTFLFNVDTLSMTTSAVCMGFDYLGGGAVHEPVAAPASMYRFRDEDLFADVVAAQGA